MLSFLAPMFLAGAAAVALPIVLHLLGRGHRSVDRFAPRLRRTEHPCGSPRLAPDASEASQLLQGGGDVRLVADVGGEAKRLAAPRLGPPDVIDRAGEGAEAAERGGDQWPAAQPPAHTQHLLEA